MKMISLFSLLSRFSISSLQAGSIEEAQWMPWGFLQNELKIFPLKLTLAQPLISLDLGELKPTLKGFEASFENSYWKPSLAALNLSFNPANWNLSQVQCAGISGVDDQITEQIKLALTSPDTIERLLKEKLSSELDRLWKDTWASLLKTSGGELKGTSMERPSDRGVLIIAEIPLQLVKADRERRTSYY